MHHGTGSILPNSSLYKREPFAPYSKALQRIFADMDQSYQEVAGGYGFDCRECTDNCCLTRFYHHTFLEFFYMQEGLQTLPAVQKEQVSMRAAEVVRAYAEADKTGDTIRVMCPLNSSGRCMLYAYRPMICRMHGIPHRLDHPVRGVVTGPGCHLFEKEGRQSHGIRFDRTPGYSSLAALEKKLRQTANLAEKIRLTVADMIVAMHPMV